jgi:hypothetical protein
MFRKTNPNSTALHYSLHSLSLLAFSSYPCVDEGKCSFVVVDKQLMVAYK